MSIKNDILEKTLTKMRVRFTSNEFCDTARKLGLTKNDIDQGSAVSFLRENAIQSEESRRTWNKKSLIKVDSTNLTSEQTAIELLKLLGYKIMKRTSEWLEV